MPRLGIVAAEIVGLSGLALAIELDGYDYLSMFSAILLFGLWWDAGPIARLLRASWCVWLGRISFSVYLLHFPIITAADKFYPAKSGAGWQQSWRFMAVVGAILAISSLTYIAIERPFQWLGQRRRRLDAVSRQPIAASSPS
jgi:peptidoglycan/LPS O-acetylase OafA/YrhL